MRIACIVVSGWDWSIVEESVLGVALLCWKEVGKGLDGGGYDEIEWREQSDSASVNCPFASSEQRVARFAWTG